MIPVLNVIAQSSDLLPRSEGTSMSVPHGARGLYETGVRYGEVSLRNYLLYLRGGHVIV